MTAGDRSRPIWRDPLRLIAFGFGSGLSPFAPGTVGTVVGVAFYWAMRDLATIPYLAVVAAMFAVGVWLCGTVASRLGVHDHPGIVWDEIVGYLVTMCCAPNGVLWIGAGFVLFRLFDIWKPFPIRWLDRRVPGGLGVMVDDVLAGIYAAGCLALLSWTIA